MPKRILGIDYGTQRIGISLSDPLGIIAQPYTTLQNNKEVYTRLYEIAQKEDVELFVVGMPYNLKGQMTQKAREVIKFIEFLRQVTSCPVIPWDERFTTTIAHSTLRTLGTKKKDRNQKSGKLDQMAAALILQSYLDRNQPTLLE
ncbi:MAG: Holliday junction resolvase RuvX [Bacteroidetes bacterium]|nr:Holliday junction resolvase RuvX [Bacteroidota bacterium]